MASSERDRLLAWYDASARDLPWRRTRDPYAIWVSEVMLQQTRVDTVIPYYHRFLERFPTTAALAEAPEDRVLAAWSGLGYYRRARLLHRGVREVVARYGGRIPEGRDERLALPGVGRYTAGAIGSIAFDRPEPIVDGNVARVLARLRGIDTPLGRADTERRLWDEAERWALGPRPGAVNQALMELGATVCTPSAPRCDACPLRARCHAHRAGETGRLPVPKARTQPRGVALVAVVATSGRGEAWRVWLERGEGSLFGGMWAPPMVEVESPDAASARRALAEAGVTAKLAHGAPAGEVTHVLSHRRLAVTVYRASGARGARTEGRGLFSEAELARLGVTRLTRKILECARSTRG